MTSHAQRLAEYQAIERRCDKATRGPWYQCSDGWYVRTTVGDTEFRKGAPVCSTFNTGGSIEKQVDDSDFIAHVREDVPYLLERVRGLEEQVRKAGCPRCAARVE